MKQKFNQGGAINPHEKTDTGSTFNTSSSGEQSAWSGGYNQGNQQEGSSPFHPSGNYDQNKNKVTKVYSSFDNDKGNTSTGTTTNNDDGFINYNNNSSDDGNELSILDQISEQNFQTEEQKKLLKLAEDKQNKKKKIWGLNTWSEENLNGGSVDTSDDVVDDILNLKEASDKMMKLLGLDPTKKKSMLIALNYLSNDQWGSQLKLKNSQNAAAIDALVNSKADGWKTWGTRLRGDAAWKGVGPMDKDTYSKTLGEMTAKVEPGSTAWDYQRALINSHKPLKSEGGFSEFITSIFFPGLASMAKSKTGSKVIDWLNSKNEAGEIGIDENGIFNFEMYGNEININNGKNFDDFGIDFKDYIIEEKDTQDNEIGGNYKTYSFDNTGVVDDEEEDEEEDESQVVYDYDDDNPAWFDMTLFTKFFSGKFDKKNDVFEIGPVESAKEGGIVRKK